MNSLQRVLVPAHCISTNEHRTGCCCICSGRVVGNSVIEITRQILVLSKVLRLSEEIQESEDMLCVVSGPVSCCPLLCSWRQEMKMLRHYTVDTVLGAAQPGDQNLI